MAQTTCLASCHVPYFLGPSPSFSGLPVTFPPVPNRFPCVLWHFPSVSVSLRCLLICSIIRPFRVFHLFPSISLFQLVSFQFSILGSDRSEFGSLLSICLHSCSATIPFPLISVFYCRWSYDLRFPFQLWSVSYCSVLYINPASYVVIR